MDSLPAWLQPYLQPETITAYAQSLLLALVTIAVGYIAAGWVARLTLSALKRANVDIAIARFLGNIARYVVLVATAIATAEAVGIETTSLLAIMASAGLAVGLALQGNLANFASGVMILLFRPFRIDDWVTAQGLTGQVQDIGLFATAMMRPDGTKVIVPNSALTGSIIENHTELNKRRATVDIGVEYGCDIDEARAALTRAASKVADILPNDDGDKDFVVYFASFGASSLDFQIHAWCEAANWLSVQEELRVEVYKELDRARIGIPFPQLDLHLDQALEAKLAS